MTGSDGCIKLAGQSDDPQLHLESQRDSTVRKMAPKPKHVIHPIHGYKIKPTENLKTIKRNERERHRVQNLNNGFEILRQNIPAVAAMKKMSKINILSHAVNYIQYLHQILDSNNSSVKTESSMIGYENYQHLPSYHPQQQLHSPVSPTMSCYDSDTSGVFSDYSLQSPVWQPQPHHVQSYHHQQPHQHHYQQHQVSSSTDQISSDEEDDVIEAIADWQHNQV